MTLLKVMVGILSSAMCEQVNDLAVVVRLKVVIIVVVFLTLSSRISMILDVVTKSTVGEQEQKVLVLQ